MYGQPIFRGQSPNVRGRGQMLHGSGGAQRGGPPRGASRGGSRGVSRGGFRGGSRGGSTPRGAPRGRSRVNSGPNANRGGGFGRGNSNDSFNNNVGNQEALWRYDGCFRSAAPFFIDSSALLDIKKQVVSQCQNVKDVTPICQQKARFTYIAKVRSLLFAVRHSGKQPDWLRAGKGYSCGICDVFTDTHGELKEHNETTTHKEIMALFRKFDSLCREWFRQFNDSGYSLTMFAADAEKNGLTVNKDDVSTCVPVTPLNDLLFQDLDVCALNEEEFVLASYDSIMEVHWPKPVTQYYCRECNYTSFLNQQQLDVHKGSNEHKQFEANYNTSWCVSCQFHTGTQETLALHSLSARHKMIVKMLEDVRLKALDYHKRQRANLEKIRLQDAAQREQQFNRFQSFNESNFSNGFVRPLVNQPHFQPAVKKRRFGFE